MTIADYSNFIEARNGQISADAERDSRTSVPLGAGQSISLSPDNLLRGRAGPLTLFARYSPRCPAFIALQDDPDLSTRDCRFRTRHRRQRLGGAILETDPA